MKTIHIPIDTEWIISSSSKGDQSKWRIGNKWVKQNARGYEGQAEVLASLVLECLTFDRSNYVVYQPCTIQLTNGEQFDGCYSPGFRGTKQEVTLERLFEANFSSTDPITNKNTLSTTEKFEQLMAQVEQFTGLDVCQQIAQLFAFDALILNEDRHTNNILFVYDPKEKAWELAPIFDNGLSLLSDEKDYPPSKPLTILKRKVKAKPLNSSFTRQLALYEGSPFIDKDKLIAAIEQSPYDFSRAKDVLLSQLRDPALKHLFMEGSEAND